MTRILALETSGLSGSVAACDGEQLLLEMKLDATCRSARTLAPTMRELLRNVDWRPSDVQALAVAIGPGSFTGLRVGVTAAKAYAYALETRLVGVDTLDVIAHQALEADVDASWPLAVSIDAQRFQVYSSLYTRASPTAWRRIRDTTIVADQEWLASLPRPCVVSGSALVKLAEQLPPHASLAARVRWHPRAVSVGVLAARRLANGESDDPFRLKPFYLRRSAAEEKLG